MRIVRFSVKNFRSITQTRSLPLNATTVLIGPNNEGKSNLVKALAKALTILTNDSKDLRSAYMLRNLLSDSGTSTNAKKHAEQTTFRVGQHIFNWADDFPVSLQGESKQHTEFTVEFELSASEIDEFRAAIGSNLNGTLPIRISIDQNGFCEISVRKPGKGQKALTDKSAKITAFIGARLDFQHIPAIRTSETADEIVSSLIASKLREVEQTTEYKKALELLEKVQKPILDDFARSITPTMQKFVPSLTNIQFRIQDRQRALRRTELILDDGSPTLLSAKGDGVQSLAALALMKHSSEVSAGKKHVVIAIEEPEAHLHPAAIHAIHSVIRELSVKQQVVVTTHNPIFVQRDAIAANIIVQGGSAEPARSVAEIRTSLGIRASDNLMHASLVLLVEGMSDRRAMTALLSERSKILKKALTDGVIVIDQMHGASNYVYKASQFKEALCLVHCLLDDDQSGRQAYASLTASGVVESRDITLTKVEGFREAELEDLLDSEIYKEAISLAYRVSLDNPKFKGNSKWSDRMKAVFTVHGKQWDKSSEEKCKELVASAVESSPAKALMKSRQLIIAALANELEARLGETERD